MKRVCLFMKFFKLVKVEIFRFNIGKKMILFMYFDLSIELRLMIIGDVC